MNITAIGLANENELAKRSGAKPNDLLVVTGDLGGAYMGLQILEREHSLLILICKWKWDYILERQLKPEARTDIKKTLTELDITPTSIDISDDGLASEINKALVKAK